MPFCNGIFPPLSFISSFFLPSESVNTPPKLYEEKFLPIYGFHGLLFKWIMILILWVILFIIITDSLHFRLRRHASQARKWAVRIASPLGLCSQAAGPFSWGQPLKCTIWSSYLGFINSPCFIYWDARLFWLGWPCRMQKEELRSSSLSHHADFQSWF